MKLPISVFIICKDEVERLEMVLRSVAELSSDIVVVDSGSTDGTIELAKLYTDRVYHREWSGFGEQKLYGERLCKNNWVLNLDADEVLSIESRLAIAHIVERDPNNLEKNPGYELRVTMMSGLNQVSKPSFMAPYNFTGRFYDKRYAGFASSTVHDKLTEHSTGIQRFPRLPGHVYHYSIKSYSHMWNKIGNYSEMQARSWIDKGREPKLWLVFFEAPFFFIKHYIFRRLFALGTRGFVIALVLTGGRVMRRVLAAEMLKGKR
jgi:glycosyltransferase involved in cell wall biosynthesis